MSLEDDFPDQNLRLFQSARNTQLIITFGLKFLQCRLKEIQLLAVFWRTNMFMYLEGKIRMNSLDQFKNTTFFSIHGLL